MQEIEEKLFKQIPILTQMGVKVEEYSREQIVVSSKLQDHYNYEGTAFGGSLNTVALLPCFLMAKRVLEDAGISPKSLVIQSSEIKYLKPVSGNFRATCLYPDPSLFIRNLKRRGIARIELNSKITLCEGQSLDDELVSFVGRFVATL